MIILVKTHCQSASETLNISQKLLLFGLGFDLFVLGKEGFCTRPLQGENNPASFLQQTPFLCVKKQEVNYGKEMFRSLRGKRPGSPCFKDVI